MADEFLFEYPDASPAWRTGRIEAIQLLMAIDRNIYFECAELPSLRDRALPSSIDTDRHRA